MSGYDALTLRVTAADVELTVAQMWARGTLGLESRDEDGRIVLIAYFDRGRLEPDGWRRGYRILAGRPVEVVSLAAFEERDWLADYRRAAAPFGLGSRFWVDPGEPNRGCVPAPIPDGRCLLRLPARSAFGTGSHESTRLAVEFLESLPVAGKRLLDVGTGTGVLSFVAVREGAASVVAIESDPGAALLAGRNQILNGVSFPLVAGRIQALAARATFDLAVVNVIPELIAEDLDDIARRLKRPGAAIFSGCLREHGAHYRVTLAGHGFHTVAARELGDWQALLTELGDR